MRVLDLRALPVLVLGVMAAGCADAPTTVAPAEAIRGAAPLLAAAPSKGIQDRYIVANAPAPLSLGVSCPYSYWYSYEHRVFMCEASASGGWGDYSYEWYGAYEYEDPYSPSTPSTAQLECFFTHSVEFSVVVSDGGEGTKGVYGSINCSSGWLTIYPW